MTDLKEFYETEIRAKSKYMPVFEHAHPETLKVIKKSITFALWKLKKAITKLKQSFNHLILKIKL